MIPYRDSIPCQYTPWVTWSLVIVNFALFLLQWFLPEAMQVHLLYFYGLVPARYASPEWAAWVGLPPNDYAPLITHMFLHGGWLHVMLNMWMLWIFGDNVEDRMGSLRFIVFYLVCGLAAAGAQIYANPNAAVPVVGASGALAGVMGAYFFMYPYARIVIWVFFLPLFVQVPAIAFLGVWVIIQLYKATNGLAGNEPYADVAWWGHLGGFIVGVLLHRLFLLQERGPPPGFDLSQSKSS
ncbi:MAG: rhomboid family intramembrane serine protease [Methylococcaceae bacterium]|nr:rhomboid family intramembrane serine protease [Methylococcaceae bacterium]